jgi:hypothetical protein
LRQVLRAEMVMWCIAAGPHKDTPTKRGAAESRTPLSFGAWLQLRNHDALRCR